MTDTQTDSGYPKWWGWDAGEDGEEVAGTFVRLGNGHTAQGDRVFVVLDVNGVERTVWLHHSVLHNQFRRELYRRPGKQFEVGERIEIRQLGTKEGGNGREYMNYNSQFPDGPVSSQADILGPPPEPPAKADDVPGDDADSDAAKPDDDIPF